MNNWCLSKIMSTSSFLRHLLLKFSLHYLLANILFTEGLAQDQYLGCLYDNSSQLLHWENSFSNNSMNIELCIEHCRTTGSNTYAKLLHGTVCQCVDDYGIQLSDLVCNLTCAGNRSEYCGGVIEEQLTTYVLYAVCPVGNYSTQCDRVCHCKQQITCNRTTGQCPDGCDRDYTGSTCNTTSTTYIGCFQDNNEDRALPNQVHSQEYSRITIELCIGWCSEIYSSFAGAQYGGQCFCGESYDKYGQLNENQCYQECSGDRNEKCGGPNVNSVYSVCPAGYYGDGCSRRCNCLNDGRCVYRNGSCFSSLCKPGWTGSSCNIRDCATANGACNTNETCLTVDLKFNKFNVCRCSEGFSRNKFWQNCTDTDECATTPSVCGEGALSCINSIGGYSCYCKNDQTTYKESCVLDVEECSQTPPICGTEAVNCSNTYGSYICHCKNGDVIHNGSCILMESSKNGKKVARIIGAIVGSICGFLVILAIIAVMICYRRNWCETPPAEVMSSPSDVQSAEIKQQYQSAATASDQPSNPNDSTNSDLFNVKTSSTYEQLKRDAIGQDDPHSLYQSLEL